MGYIASATTINIKGKLTPLGRQKLATNNNGLITSFALGDSDANYNVYTGLTTGNIPDFSGDNFGASINNGGANYVLRSNLYYQGTTIRKPVETSSIVINSQFQSLGTSQLAFSGGSIDQLQVNRLDFNTDEFVNLFYTFGLPTSTNEAAVYTANTSVVGGFSDTALSGLANNEILVIGIASGEYGELIDGKSIKLTINTSSGATCTATTYDIYGTYERKNIKATIEDKRVYDTSSNLKQLGPNRCLLFCDTIKRPNGDSGLTWSTGYGLNKPFSLNQKQPYNFKANTNLGINVDKAVGIAYLDKGFCVITEPAIVECYNPASSGATATTITFDSVVNSISQQITCIAGRKEFATSTNHTFASGDVPRITEIGLYDNSGNLIAIGKTSRTYYKPTDDLVVFNLVIEY